MRDWGAHGFLNWDVTFSGKDTVQKRFFTRMFTNEQVSSLAW